MSFILLLFLFFLVCHTAFSLFRNWLGAGVAQLHTVTRLQAKQSRVSNPNRGKKCFFSPCSHWIWGPHSHLYKEYQGYFQAIEQPAFEVNHSPPSSNEVQNERRLPLLLPYTFIVWAEKTLPFYLYLS
jgi:hypothetical protein